MRTLRRLWPYYRSGWHLVLLSLVQIGIAAGLGLALPLLIRWVVDHVLTGGEWDWLIPGAGAIVVVAALQGLVRFGQRYTMELVSQRVIYEIRSQLYRHLQSLSFGFYDRAKTGELMSRVTADVEAVRHAAGMGLVNGMMNFVTVIGIITVMFVLDWRLSLVSLIFLPFLIHALVQFATKARPAWMAVQGQTATLSSAIQENIAGVRVVRAFAREEEEITKFGKENAIFFEQNLLAIRLQSFWSNYMNFLTAVGAVAVLWYGGRRVMSGDISVGTLIAFNAYIANLVNPVRMLGWIVAIFTRAGAALHRIFELLDTQSDVEEKTGAVVLDRVRGEVRLEEISFRYEGGQVVLEEIDLSVKPGQRIAVLGMTGSGKTSLINLIPRFYDPTEGRVRIDGVDVRDVTLESLRRQIGMVLQESFLFSTTLGENIAYGKPGAKMAEITAAAKAAQIHDFIQGLPDKYETVVGERGVGLSGGQKQRISIARALLTDSPILILDESTSAIDVATEHLIQAAVEKVMQGRTSFVIASRLSTVMNADLVLVLDQGRIAESGTHADLIQQDGLYRKIYELQLKPAEEYRASKGVAV
jgi:ABC-type multidrug transport system fused ATPase/permease subunit